MGWGSERGKVAGLAAWVGEATAEGRGLSARVGEAIRGAEGALLVAGSWKSLDARGALGRLWAMLSGECRFVPLFKDVMGELPSACREGKAAMNPRSYGPLWLALLVLLAGACGVDSSDLAAGGDGGGQAEVCCYHP